MTTPPPAQEHTLPRPGTRRVSRSFGAFVGAVLGALALIASVVLLGAPAQAARQGTAAGGAAAAKPTVVLVHGAFADASGWAGVVTRLQRLGYPVIAPANPLRSVSGDSTYLRSVLANISGRVILVGHSYGGVVITNAATGDPDVKALVYVAAFGPDQGESVGQLTAQFPGSQLTPNNLVIRPYATSPTDTGADGYINPAVFRTVFCADLPAGEAAVMAATQRPGALATLGEPSGAPAWKTIPSWYLVARQDNAIPADAERFMAHRMGAHTIEVDSSHVAMISHPKLVTSLITQADRATR